MHLEIIETAVGKDGRESVMQHGIVRGNDIGSLKAIASEIRTQGVRFLLFAESETFADPDQGIAVCREMRAQGMNVLWSARLSTLPTSELLREMRLAGCQRLEMELESDDAWDALERAREFGFEVSLRNADGAAYAVDSLPYSVADREAIVERLPGLHSVQFDLAVAYYNAQRYRDVMLPLGKAMTLRFPLNELCLNLLACLSAAKHYPDMAAGLLRQAEHGCPHPVVFRNRNLLKSWLESGGDVKGIRLTLDPDGSVPRHA